MNQRKAGIMTVIMLGGSLAIAGAAIGDDKNKDKDKYEHGDGNRFSRLPDVASPENAAYRKECGSCHFAYQPGLLPARSWKKVMNTLDNHFGENAELDAETQKELTAYLLAHSAERSTRKASFKILNSIGEQDTPVAITKTPYFVHKHREVPDRMGKGNPLVKSMAHCAKCHTGAEAGSYSEHEVVIPGYGAFED